MIERAGWPGLSSGRSGGRARRRCCWCGAPSAGDVQAFAALAAGHQAALRALRPPPDGRSRPRRGPRPGDPAPRPAVDRAPRRPLPLRPLADGDRRQPGAQGLAGRIAPPPLAGVAHRRLPPRRLGRGRHLHPLPRAAQRDGGGDAPPRRGDRRPALELEPGRRAALPGRPRLRAGRPVARSPGQHGQGAPLRLPHPPASPARRQRPAPSAPAQAEPERSPLRHVARPQPRHAGTPGTPARPGHARHAGRAR